METLLANAVFSSMPLLADGASASASEQIATVFIVFGCTTLIAVAGTIGYFWHKTRRDRIDASVKLAMLEKGMSADDIVKVLNARPGEISKNLEERDHRLTAKRMGFRDN